MGPWTPNVRLELSSRPDSVTLVRGMLGGVAEPLALNEEQLIDLKTAVSEACNNVVQHAYSGGPGPLAVSLAVHGGSIDVVVRDWGTGIYRLRAAEDKMHVGLAMINALAERAEFIRAEEGGTEVRMSFRSRSIDPRADGEADPDEAWWERPRGEIVVTVSPLNLLGGVLGRMTRALAARSRFRLDRFSDIGLVTDTITAHAASSASGAGISFGLSAEPKWLELKIGPFRAGTCRPLREASEQPAVLPLLADQLSVEPAGDSEMVRLVMQDHAGAVP